MQRKKPRLIIFDLDGTLVDSRRDIAASINQGLAAIGAAPSRFEEIYPLIGKPLFDMYVALLPASLVSRVEEAVHAYRTHYIDHCAEETRLYPGVRTCLTRLSHIPLAIATTKMTFMAVEVVSRLGIIDLFEIVQGCDDIPHKPDPAVLHAVLGCLGADADSCWMVGDTVLDIMAAKAIRMPVCAVTYGIGQIADLRRAQPELMVNSLADFSDQIG